MVLLVAGLAVGSWWSQRKPAKGEELALQQAD